MFLGTIFFMFCAWVYVGSFSRVFGSGFFYVSVFFFFFTVFCASWFFYEVGLVNIISYLNGIDWLSVDFVSITWSTVIDTVTVSMLVVISIIGLCAFMFSRSYLSDEPHDLRFFSYLCLFTCSMMLLVLSDNALLLFVGWEGVGICSFLLINFWASRVQANKAAILAVLINKIGDITLMIGIALLIVCFKSVDFDVLNSIFCTSFGTHNFYIVHHYYTILVKVCFFLLIAAACKSAQASLHLWLPDAMEGPTPVSSLIHAATMVTAGIILLFRFSHLFEFIDDFDIFIIMLGSVTSFFSALIAIFQNDIKKIIAYSTCSQLGYLFTCCGLLSHGQSMFHLFNHAFFKALLFLTAGYLINIKHHEQDLRFYGGLFHITSFAYVMLAIGSFSLMGFTFFSGFYSKEKIIDLLLNLYSVGFEARYVYAMQFFSVMAALFTVLYSVKLFVYSFVNIYNGVKKNVSVISSFFFMYMPLIILAFFSVVGGFFFSDMMVGHGTIFWQNSFPVISEFVIDMVLDRITSQTDWYGFLWLEDLFFVFDDASVFNFLSNVVNYCIVVGRDEKFVINNFYFDETMSECLTCDDNGVCKTGVCRVDSGNDGPSGQIGMLGQSQSFNFYMSNLEDYIMPLYVGENPRTELNPWEALLYFIPDPFHFFTIYHTESSLYALIQRSNTESNYYDRFVTPLNVFIMCFSFSFLMMFLIKKSQTLVLISFSNATVIISKFVFLKRFLYIELMISGNDVAYKFYYSLLDKGFIEYLTIGVSNLIRSICSSIMYSALIYHQFGWILVIATVVLALVAYTVKVTFY